MDTENIIVYNKHNIGYTEAVLYKTEFSSNSSLKVTAAGTQYTFNHTLLNPIEEFDGVLDEWSVPLQYMVVIFYWTPALYFGKIEKGK